MYAQEHLNNYVRAMLMKMLEWEVGTRTDFSLSVGKCSKYIKNHLPEDRWQLLMDTYAGDHTKRCGMHYSQADVYSV